MNTRLPVQPLMFSGPRKVGEGRCGPYPMHILTNCEKGYGTGDSLPVKYAHLVIVFGGDGHPIYMVSAEYDDQYDAARDEPLALGVFDELGHRVVAHAFGVRDLQTFLAEARHILLAHFGREGRRAEG